MLVFRQRPKLTWFYVQHESLLIQKLYTHFKKTSGSHKLGVLYVVDSVLRKWMDQAKQNGQAINNTAADSTFAAGVNRSVAARNKYDVGLCRLPPSRGWVTVCAAAEL